jgi:hypothetical protein
VCAFPSCHLSDEVFCQPFNIGERVRALLAINVAMITLATLIIETNDTPTMHDIDQPVLERMRAWRNRLRYAPHNHLDQAATIGRDSLGFDYLFGFHVGKYDNKKYRARASKSSARTLRQRPDSQAEH